MTHQPGPPSHTAGRPGPGGEVREIRPWAPALAVLVALPLLTLVSTLVADWAGEIGALADIRVRPLINVFRPVGSLEFTGVGWVLGALAIAAVVAFLVTWAVVALSGRRAALVPSFLGGWAGTLVGFAIGAAFTAVLRYGLYPGDLMVQRFTDQLYWGLGSGATAGLLLGWLVGVIALAVAAVTRTTRPADSRG